MKRVILSCAILAALAVSCTEGVENYYVKGSVTNSELEGSTIYLSECSNKTVLDSVVVTNGSFELKGAMATPTLLQIRSGRQTAIVASTEPVAVSIDQTIAIEQGDESIKISEINESVSELYSQFMAFVKENSDDKEAQQAKYDEYKEGCNDIMKSHLLANPDNLVGAYVVAKQSSSMKSLEQIDSLIALAPLSAEQYIVIKNRKSREQAAKTAVGEQYIDFTGTDIEGNPSKLSDFVGKGNYVLVDFWASWCGPCRAEMPNLRNVYKKHEKNGLILLGVNVWDSKEPCLKAIEEEEMTWPILYASDNQTATDSYGILGIPTIILFGPDGTIVDRTARGAKIMELIDSVYAK